MNVATAPAPLAPAQQPLLPELGRLQSRIMFPAKSENGPMSFVDVTPKWQVALDPKTPFYSSISDAVKAAQLFATRTNQPIGVLEGTTEVISPDAKFYLAPLEEVRHGTVRESWTNGGTQRELRGRIASDKLTGPILSGTQMPQAIDTKDISEIRYVLHNESVRAIVAPKWSTQRDQEDGVRWTGSVLNDPFGF